MKSSKQNAKNAIFNPSKELSFIKGNIDVGDKSGDKMCWWKFVDVDDHYDLWDELLFLFGFETFQNQIRMWNFFYFW